MSPVIVMKDQAKSTELSTEELERITTVRSKQDLRETDKVSPSDFELISVLGKGACGIVYLVEKKGGKDNGKLYAMKVIKKTVVLKRKKSAEHARIEREVLEAIRQFPFLVTLHYAFQTDCSLYYVLDYVNGGELYNHLDDRCQYSDDGRCFTEDEVRIFIAEIVIAIEQLHKMRIVYRDIKLENILLDSDGHIVIADVGLSKQLPKKRCRTNSFCGTIQYMAPEMIRDTNGHSFNVDWWAVGVMCYELLTGLSPFNTNEDTNKDYVKKMILQESPPMTDVIGEDASDLIMRLLNKDESRRLGTNGAAEIKNHRFFQKIDWDKLARKEIPAPFKPNITHDLDTSNFCEDFTGLPVVIEPSTPPPNHERLFRGFSFVAPEHLECDMSKKRKRNIEEDEEIANCSKKRRLY